MIKKLFKKHTLLFSYFVLDSLNWLNWLNMFVLSFAVSLIWNLIVVYCSTNNLCYKFTFGVRQGKGERVYCYSEFHSPLVLTNNLFLKKNINLEYSEYFHFVLRCTIYWNMGKWRAIWRTHRRSRKWKKCIPPTWIYFSKFSQMHPWLISLLI